MIVERSWRINPQWLTYTHKDEAYLFSHINDDYGVHAEGQNSLLPLVPDSRLQAIADAWKYYKPLMDVDREAMLRKGESLVKLLDALTEKCICVKFKDTGGFRIADLTCPIHGIAGTSPGDWQENNDE